MTGRPRNFDPDQVLAQAMGVFWAKGFDGTGVADLEQATGLGRQSLYGAFGDKRALFLRVVDFYFEQVLKPGLIGVLDAPGSGLAALDAVFAQWETLAVSPDFQGCLVGNAAAELHARDAELAEVLRRKLRLVEEGFYRAVRRAIDQGELAADLDARATARALVTTAQGLAVVAKVHKERAFVRSVIASARRLLS